MNTLEDLRATLAGHADDAVGPTVDPRVHAVHARIQRVRRQRRASIAGGVAAAVLIAAGVVTGLTLPAHQSAPPSLIAGHALAPTVQVDGMAYDIGTTAQSSPGETSLTLKLPKSDRDRVVSLVASGLGGGWATLYVGNGRPDYVTSGRHRVYDAASALDRIVSDSAVDDPVEVSTDATRLTVRVTDAAANAVVGLAVYDQGSVLPQGVSADGMVYPQTIGDEQLVAATIDRVGQDSVSITFTGPLRHPDLESLCATDAKGIMGHVTLTSAKLWSGGECGPLDPVNDVNLGVLHGEGVPTAGYGPGRHTITLTARRGTFGHLGTPVDLSDVRLGLGLYDDRSPVRRIVGLDWDTRVLSAGRAWQLDRVVRVHGPVSVDATDSPVMLGEAYRGRASSCIVATGADGARFEGTCIGGSPSSGSGASGTVLMPGTTYTVTTQDPRDSSRRGVGLTALLIYRPAD